MEPCLEYEMIAKWIRQGVIGSEELKELTGMAYQIEQNKNNKDDQLWSASDECL